MGGIFKLLLFIFLLSNSSVFAESLYSSCQILAYLNYVLCYGRYDGNKLIWVDLPMYHPITNQLYRYRWTRENYVPLMDQRFTICYGSGYYIWHQYWPGQCPKLLIIGNIADSFSAGVANGGFVHPFVSPSKYKDANHYFLFSTYRQFDSYGIPLYDFLYNFPPFDCIDCKQSLSVVKAQILSETPYYWNSLSGWSRLPCWPLFCFSDYQTQFQYVSFLLPTIALFTSFGIIIRRKKPFRVTQRR